MFLKLFHIFLLHPVLFTLIRREHLHIENKYISLEWNQMGFGFDDLDVCLRILSYLSTKHHRYSYLSMRNTIRTLIVEELYYGLIFLHTEQCKAIHYELSTYFIA